MNDFKLLCPSYNLVSQGEACEACKGGAFWHVLRLGLLSRAGGADDADDGGLRSAVGWDVRKMCGPVSGAQPVCARQVRRTRMGHRRSSRCLPHFQAATAAVERAAEKNAPLLYFGRLSAEKGVSDLLRAMQRLPELRLVVAGDGPQRGELRAAGSDPGLE